MHLTPMQMEGLKRDFSVLRASVRRVREHESARANPLQHFAQARQGIRDMFENMRGVDRVEGAGQLGEIRVNFDAQLFRRLRRGGLHGPLWQHLRGFAGSHRVTGIA